MLGERWQQPGETLPVSGLALRIRCAQALATAKRHLGIV